MGKLLKGIGLTVEVDGEDLVVADTLASNFGDPRDVLSGQDNGIGANGFRYIAHPKFVGCALPLCRHGHSLSGSPLPAGLPIRNASGSASGIQVRIQSLATRKVVTAELVDLGPTGSLHRGIDLLPGTVAQLGLSMRAGLYHVRYRILGGAAYL